MASFVGGEDGFCFLIFEGDSKDDVAVMVTKDEDVVITIGQGNKLPVRSV